MSIVKENILKILNKEMEILSKTNVPLDLFKLNNTPLTFAYTIDSFSEAVKEIYGYEIFNYSGVKAKLNNFDSYNSEVLSTIEANYNLLVKATNDIFNGSLELLNGTLSLNLKKNTASSSIKIKEVENEDAVFKLRDYEHIYNFMVKHPSTENQVIKITKQSMINNLQFSIKATKDELLKDKIDFLLDNNCIIEFHKTRTLVYSGYYDADLTNEYNDLIRHLKTEIDYLKSVNAKEIHDSTLETGNNDTSMSQMKAITIESSRVYAELKNRIFAFIETDVKASFVDKYKDILFTIKDDTVFFNSKEKHAQKVSDEFYTLFDLDNIFLAKDDYSDTEDKESDLMKLDKMFIELDNLLKEESLDYCAEQIEIINAFIKEHSNFNVFKEDYTTSVDNASLVGKSRITETSKCKITYTDFTTNTTKEYSYNNQKSNVCSSTIIYQENTSPVIDCRLDITIAEGEIYIEKEKFDELIKSNDIAIYSPKLSKYTKNGFIRITKFSDNTMVLNASDIVPEYHKDGKLIILDMNEFINVLNSSDKFSLITIGNLVEDETMSPNDILDITTIMVSNIKEMLSFYLNTISDIVYIAYFRARVTMLSAKKDFFSYIEDVLSSKNKLKVTLREIFGIKHSFADLNMKLVGTLTDNGNLAGSSLNAVALFFEKISQLIMLCTLSEKTITFEHIKITENTLGRYTDLVDIALMLFDEFTKGFTTLSFNPTAEKTDLILDFKRKLLSLTYTIAPKHYLNDRYIIDVETATEEQIDDIIPELNFALDSIIEKIDKQGEIIKDYFGALIAPLKLITKTVTCVVQFIIMFKKYPTLIEDSLLLCLEIAMRNLSENIIYQPIAEHYSKWNIYKQRIDKNYSDVIQEVNISDVFNDATILMQNNVNSVDNFIKTNLSIIDAKFAELGYIDNSITESKAKQIINNDKAYANYIDTIRNRSDYTSVYDVDLQDLYLQRNSRDLTIVYHPFRTESEDQKDLIMEILSDIVLFELKLYEEINRLIFTGEVNSSPDNFMSYRLSIISNITSLENIALKDYLLDYLDTYKETKGMIKETAFQLNDGYYTYSNIHENLFINESLSKSDYDNALQVFVDLYFTHGKKFRSDIINFGFTIQEDMFTEVKNDYLKLFDNELFNFMEYEVGSLLTNYRFKITNLIDISKHIDNLQLFNEKFTKINKNSKSDKVFYPLYTEDVNLEDDVFKLVELATSKIFASFGGYHIISSVTKDLDYKTDDEKLDDCQEISVQSLLSLRSNKVKNSASYITLKFDEIFDLSPVDEFYDILTEAISVVVDMINKARSLSFLTAKNNLKFWDSNLQALSERLNEMLNECEQRGFASDNVTNGNDILDNSFCLAIKIFWSTKDITDYITNYLEKNYSFCEQMLKDLYVKLKSLRDEDLNNQQNNFNKLSENEMTNISLISKKMMDVFLNYDVNGIESKTTSMCYLYISKFCELYAENKENQEFQFFIDACNECIEFKANGLIAFKEDIIDSSIIDKFDSEVVYKFTVKLVNDDEYRLLTLDEFIQALEVMIKKPRANMIKLFNSEIEKLNKLKDTMNRTNCINYITECIVEMDAVLRVNNFYRVMGMGEIYDEIEIDDVSQYIYKAGYYNNVFVENIFEPSGEEEAVAISYEDEASTTFSKSDVLYQSDVSKTIYQGDLWNLPALYKKGDINYKVSIKGKSVYTKYLTEAEIELMNNNCYMISEHHYKNTTQTDGLLNYTQPEDDFEYREEVDLLLGILEAFMKTPNENAKITDYGKDVTNSLNYLMELVSSVDSKLGNTVKQLTDDLQEQKAISKIYDLLNTCSIYKKPADNKMNISFPSFKENAENIYKKYNATFLISSNEIVDKHDDTDIKFCI